MTKSPQDSSKNGRHKTIFNGLTRKIVLSEVFTEECKQLTFCFSNLFDNGRLAIDPMILFVILM